MSYVLEVDLDFDVNTQSRIVQVHDHINPGRSSADASDFRWDRLN
ncbi:MAG TPA: hypothetical protein VE398_01460 [Acidobacteriota bacterium]|nr:hypothetical protein [Acidobacteriota bacterium]